MCRSVGGTYAARVKSGTEAGWIVQSVPEVAPEQTDEVDRETVSEVGVPQKNSIRCKLNRFRDSSQICRLEAYYYDYSILKVLT